MFPPASAEGPGELSLAASTCNSSSVHSPSQSPSASLAQVGLKQYLSLVLQGDFLLREESVKLQPPGQTGRVG